MRKRLVFLPFIALLCLLVSCKSHEPPESMYGSEAEKPIEYTTAESASHSNEEIWEDVPENYRPLSGDLFAVVEGDAVVGYKLGVYNGGEWEFFDCDKDGKIIEQPVTTSVTTSTTKAETTVTNSESETHAVTTVSPQTESAQEKPQQPPVTNPAVTSPTKHEDQPIVTTAAPVVTKPPVTTQPATEPPPQDTAKFSYKIVNGLSGLPSDVSASFQSSIDSAAEGNAVTRSYQSGGTWYALIYVKNGNAVTIRSVAKNGAITYKLSSNGGKTTSCYVVAVEGVNGISFSQA